jgi:hypothetical protein
MQILTKIMKDEPASYVATYCLNTSPMRLFMGRAGLKLLYHGIFVTPGQLLSSGVPHSSNILFSCSGYIHEEFSLFRSIIVMNFHAELQISPQNKTIHIAFAVLLDSLHIGELQVKRKRK